MNKIFVFAIFAFASACTSTDEGRVVEERYSPPTQQTGGKALDSGELMKPPPPSKESAGSKTNRTVNFTRTCTNEGDVQIPETDPRFHECITKNGNKTKPGVHSNFTVK